MIFRWALQWYSENVIDLGLAPTVVASLAICTVILIFIFRERRR